MVKVWNPVFTLNVAQKAKRKPVPRGSGISRRCLAVVTKVNGKYKAIVNFDKKDVNVDDKFTLKEEQLVLPFTDKSLDLRDKTYAWFKEKDKYGHNVCIIRDTRTAHLFPGIPEQYDTVRENTLISGHIVRKNGKMYFEYEDLIAFHYLSERRLIDIVIDEDKPLFNK